MALSLSFESPNEDFFRGLNMSELEIDEAFLNVTSLWNRGSTVYLYEVNENCDKCPYQVKKSKLYFICLRQFSFQFVTEIEVKVTKPYHHCISKPLMT